MYDYIVYLKYNFPVVIVLLFLSLCGIPIFPLLIRQRMCILNVMNEVKCLCYTLIHFRAESKTPSTRDYRYISESVLQVSELYFSVI